jgi:hypothetical protein
MGRGLSQQQRDILDLLPWYSEAPEAKDTPSTREIIGLLGLAYTPSNRASVSRAISRLGQRGLVLHRWGFKRGYGHTGYARATPEEIATRRAELDAFRAKYPSMP